MQATSKKGLFLIAIIGIVSMMKLKSEFSAFKGPRKAINNHQKDTSSKKLQGRALFRFSDINWDDIVDTNDWNFDDIQKQIDETLDSVK